MKRTEHGSTASGLFTLLLLALLAILGTLTVVFSAQAYRNAVAKSDARSEMRILRAVPRNVVWGEDTVGAIEVLNENGLDVLRVTYADEEEVYYKRIYCYEGRLMELFTSADREFEPEKGEMICGATVFEPVLADSMLTVRLTGTTGRTYTVHTALHTEEMP